MLTSMIWFFERGAADLGTVVEILHNDAFTVEFAAASGRTQALLTLKPPDMRPVRDDDLVSVRRTTARKH
jgi:hypothetical protein